MASVPNSETEEQFQRYLQRLETLSKEELISECVYFWREQTQREQSLKQLINELQPPR